MGMRAIFGPDDNIFRRVPFDSISPVKLNILCKTVTL